MAHTPGPWRLRMNDSGMCNGVAVSATVLPPEPFTGPYIAEVGSTVANARLIAAAPEMYEVLKRVEEFIANGIELGYIGMPDADCPDSALEVPGLVSRALAKAEGGK